MRTRTGLSYPNLTATTKTLCFSTKLRSFDTYCSHQSDKVDSPCRKRFKVSPEEYSGETPDYFDALPDDLLVCILTKFASSASSPAHFINLLLTCKRLRGLGLNSMVLSKASPKTFAIKALNWCDSAHKFLKLCSDSGNIEASYTLGMIRFYCLQNRGSGASLMAKAAIHSHAQALYSLSVIQFNGSGGSKTDKDLRAGVALCARAAFLGHVDALRELGHCLQDGYGVRQNVAEGRRFLVQANARELAACLTCPSASLTCSLLSDFGCNVPEQEPHPASRFMTEWYSGREIGPGLRMCSHVGCGRPETRKHEFRRCSVCGKVNYCSRACQAMDWKLSHKLTCAPMPRWPHLNAMDVDDYGEAEAGHS
ncbi:hypothetical protein RND81_07G206000 [Saponaria officinalis]|uniref:MYND-type domain-containing protein n=1 Tax=Saponaria officinalis TaxID=3572 RepID=A0AAW1JQT9_SAPOF